MSSSLSRRRSKFLTVLFALLIFAVLAALTKIDFDQRILTRQLSLRLLELRKNLISVRYNSSSTAARNVAVIFTSFDTRLTKPYKLTAHQMIIRNWATFMPAIQPILFMRDLNHTLAREASKAGWHILPVTEISQTGVPRLKAMYRYVFDHFNTTFYGYSNGDLLFDESLVNTLASIKFNNLTANFNNNALVIGERRNIELNTTDIEVKNVPQLASMTELFSVWAEDYFFFTNPEFCTLNWTSLADVIIGRPAYDNYLVAKARWAGVHVIDATATLTALHLSAPGLIAHEGFENEDADDNYKIIGEDFEFGEGTTDATEFVTRQMKLTGEIIAPKRPPCTCVYKFES